MGFIRIHILIIWKTKDGKNTYLERFRRFEALVSKASAFRGYFLRVPIKNIDSKEIFLNDYNNYCSSIAFNICNGLIQKSTGQEYAFIWRLLISVISLVLTVRL